MRSDIYVNISHQNLIIKPNFMQNWVKSVVLASRSSPADHEQWLAQLTEKLVSIADNPLTKKLDSLIDS